VGPNEKPEADGAAVADLSPGAMLRGLVGMLKDGKLGAETGAAGATVMGAGVVTGAGPKENTGFGGAGAVAEDGGVVTGVPSEKTGMAGLLAVAVSVAADVGANSGLAEAGAAVAWGAGDGWLLSAAGVASLGLRLKGDGDAATGAGAGVGGAAAASFFFCSSRSPLRKRSSASASASIFSHLLKLREYRRGGTCIPPAELATRRPRVGTETVWKGFCNLEDGAMVLGLG